jgi:integrase
MATSGKNRRDYGSGSVYRRASDGRWCGTIEAGYTADGSRRRITVTGKTEAEAKRRVRDRKAELDREGRRHSKRTITVKAWSDQWLADIVTKVRPNAYDADKAGVRWIVEAIGSVKLDDLTPADVRAVAKRLRAAGRSSSTALRYQGTLTRMLKAASLDGYAVPPNVLLAEKPKRAVHDRKALSLDQAMAVLAHVATMPDGSRWALAFLQGIRRGEALGLTWEQIDLDVGTLTVSWQLQALRYLDPKDKSRGFVIPDGYEARHLIGAKHLVRPKSRKGWRVQPLVPWAVNALRDWQEIAPANAHGLVYPGRGDWPRNTEDDLEQWQAIQRAAGVAHPSGRPYHRHEIRNTTATLLMELKVPESVRLAIMGHSSIAVTQGYEFVDVAQSRLALEQVAERLHLTPTDAP